MKLVINKCYGGFSVSEEAVKHYASLKGLTIYPEASEFDGLPPTYWTVSPDKRPKKLPDPWLANSLEDRQKYNKDYAEAVLCERGLERDDPILIQTAEELGEKANTRFSKLEVVEIPDGVAWEIEEYDGMEWVSEAHRTWG